MPELDNEIIPLRLSADVCDIAATTTVVQWEPTIIITQPPEVVRVRVDDVMPSNERLLKLANRSVPPISWTEESGDPCTPDEE